MPFTVTPQLQISERYLETIIKNTDTRSEDYISSAVASLNLDYQPPLFHVRGDYSLGPTFYSSNSSQNNINQQGSIAFSADRPRWSASVKGSVVSTRWPDLVSQYNEGIIVHGSQYFQEGVGFESKYLWMRRSALSFNYGYVHNDYNSELLISSETETAGSSLTFDQNEINHFSLSGSAALYSYQAGARSKSANANVGWSHQLDRHTSLQMGAGFGVSSGYNRFLLANFSIARSYEKGSVQGGYSRSLTAGGGLTSAPVLTEQVNVSASRVFTEKLSGSVSGSYGESVESRPDIEFHSRFWNGALSLNYGLFKWLNSSLSLSHYDQQTEGRISETLQSNQIILTFSSSFSAWRPFK